MVFHNKSLFTLSVVNVFKPTIEYLLNQSILFQASIGVEVYRC